MNTKRTDKNARTDSTSKPRNPVARSPLLKKGGVHEKSKTAKRRIQKEQVRSEIAGLRDELKDSLDK